MLNTKPDFKCMEHALRATHRRMKYLNFGSFFVEQGCVVPSNAPAKQPQSMSAQIATVNTTTVDVCANSNC